MSKIKPLQVLTTQMSEMITTRKIYDSGLQLEPTGGGVQSTAGTGHRQKSEPCPVSGPVTNRRWCWPRATAAHRERARTHGTRPPSQFTHGT